MPVVKLQGRKKVNTRYGLKEKITGFLIDPHGAITIELWEDFIPQIQEGSAYTFKNLRVHRNDYNEACLLEPLLDVIVQLLHERTSPSRWPLQLTCPIRSLRKQRKLNLLASKHLHSTTYALSAKVK